MGGLTQTEMICSFKTPKKQPGSLYHRFYGKPSYGKWESVAVKGTGQEQEDPPRCFFFKPGLIGPQWTGQQFGASNMKNATMLYSHV